MASELGFLALAHLQNDNDQNQNQNHNQKQLGRRGHHQTAQPQLGNNSGAASTWVWNPKRTEEAEEEEEEESWEVRAFEEDAGNVWPPRSYTCTFCRREFRSAQALGGHMNVHRRDRAKLHHPLPLPRPGVPPSTAVASSSASSSSTYVIPTPEYSSSTGGLCLLYQFPNPNNHTVGGGGGGGTFNPPPNVNKIAWGAATEGGNSPSTVLSMTPSTSSCPPNSQPCYSVRDEEELDLELRL